MSFQFADGHGEVLKPTATGSPRNLWSATPFWPRPSTFPEYPHNEPAPVQWRYRLQQAESFPFEPLE